MLAKVSYDEPRWLLFDISQNIGYGVFWTAWVQQQVHMIGHENVGPEREVVSLSSKLYGFREAASGIVPGQELALVIAGEREKMRVTWAVE